VIDADEYVILITALHNGDIVEIEHRTFSGLQIVRGKVTFVDDIMVEVTNDDGSHVILLDNAMIVTNE